MSANSMMRDLYSEKIEDVVFKLNELVKDDPKFIEEKMPKFDSKLLKELKELKDSGDYEGSDEVLDDIHRSLKKPYEELERKQLTKIVMDLSKALKKSTDLSKMSLPQLRAKMVELSQEYDLVKIFSAQNKGKSGKSKKSKESVRGKKKRTMKLGRKKRTYSKRK